MITNLTALSFCGLNHEKLVHTYYNRREEEPVGVAGRNVPPLRVPQQRSAGAVTQEGWDNFRRIGTSELVLRSQLREIRAKLKNHNGQIPSAREQCRLEAGTHTVNEWIY